MRGLITDFEWEKVLQAARVGSSWSQGSERNPLYATRRGEEDSLVHKTQVMTLNDAYLAGGGFKRTAEDYKQKFLSQRDKGKRWTDSVQHRHCSQPF